MSFGQKNDPKTFMDVIERVFKYDLDVFNIVFIDDILLYSYLGSAYKSFEDYFTGS